MTVVEECSVEIIKSILSMTFTGSIISLFLIILRPIIKNKLPKSFQYYMWLSVVIALMMPVSKIIVIPISNNSVISMKSMYDIAQWIPDTALKKPANLLFSIAMFEDKKNLKERLGAIMKHEKYSKRAVIAASVILVTVVCAILGFSTLHGVENEYRNASDDSLAYDPKYIKENEMAEVLRNYDKENIMLAIVSLNYLDDEITEAYIAITCREKNPTSEMLSEIISLASEELELDINNINLDYVDFETLTLIESMGR